jgi:tetratricopeptide (TPR) repeat protein
VNQIQEKIDLAVRLRDVDPQKAMDMVGTVRALLQDPLHEGDDESIELLRAECALNAAWANVRLGRFSAAYPEAEEGLRLFRKQGKSRGAAGCLLVIGIAKGEDGKNDEAVRFCQEAEALFVEVGDPFGRARALNASGTSHRRLGDSARAIEAYGASMAVARDNGDSQGVSRALCNIGYVHLYDKKFEQAIDHARRALAMEREPRQPGGRAFQLLQPDPGAWSPPAARRRR